MTPIRVETSAVEPVSLAEMRAYLRLDPDDGGAEDALVGGLVTAARTMLETETRRVLVPSIFRVVLSCWPCGGLLPLPLSPLVAVTRAALAAQDGTLTDLPSGTVRAGPDLLDGPCLLIDPAAPALAGRSVLIEVAAGFGGNGAPVPAPLALAIKRLAAAWFEHRGDEPGPAAPADIAALAAPFRWRRL